MDDLSNGAKVAGRFRAPFNGAKVAKYLIQLSFYTSRLMGHMYLNSWNWTTCTISEKADIVKGRHPS